jgi:hypothetical protein
MVAIGVTTVAIAESERKWVTIFNGKDLRGWTPKIVGYKYGENFGNTFRVKDGAIQVGYEAYGDNFNERFGHLFYKHKFKNYILKLDYRFTGEQAKGGPGWAWRNSGIMIHGQDPKTMVLNQDFPNSAEVQLLGGSGSGVRHTGNLCTPGTNVVMDGKLVTRHCTDSNSLTFPGDQWVSAEVEVHGNGLVIHRINGTEVLRYEQVQLDPNDKNVRGMLKPNQNLMISEGSISLQSESHPVEFKNIQIKPI